MRCTVGQIKDFKESLMWQDICDELDVWRGMIRDMLENEGLTASSRELDRLGGSAQAVRNFKDILDTLSGLAKDSSAGHNDLMKNLIKREV